MEDPQDDLRGGYSSRQTEVASRELAARPGGNAPLGTRLYWLVSLLALVLLMLVLPAFVQQLQYASTYGRERARVDVALAGLKDLEVDGLAAGFRLVAQAVGPSVVHIRTGRTVGDERPSAADEDEWSFLVPPQPEHRHESIGQGSGVIVDKEGYILTNNHVILGANEISVHLSDGREVEAMVVGSDALTDLAVLKINADNLIAIQWGDSEQLEVGDLVWAVGSPFGLERSITFGILSAKGRRGVTSSSYQDFLQTDAAVNPGNSGGPLVNIRGELVGINTAIVGRSYQGISFAIPSTIAHDVYERLKTTGKVARGWLGVGLAPITAQNFRQYSLEEPRGVLVANVLATSPAQRAGIQRGDVLLSWNGREVADPAVLSRLVASTGIGSQAQAVVLREGVEHVVAVTIAERAID